MIGVFGGTFDPIHIGHLRSALEISERFDMRVHMVPAGDPPHRNPPHASAEQRLAMLELALQGQDRLIADQREIARAGRSYTVLTLAELRQEFDEPLGLIVGHDAFVGLPAWHQWLRLFELAHIIVVERPGETRALPAKLTAELGGRRVFSHQHLHKAPAGKIMFCELTQLEVSASQVRHLIAQGRSARYLVPEPVLEYMDRVGLYRQQSVIS